MVGLAVFLPRLLAVEEPFDGPALTLCHWYISLNLKLVKLSKKYDVYLVVKFITAIPRLALDRRLVRFGIILEINSEKFCHIKDVAVEQNI